MSSRFTETEKWGDIWFRKLNPSEKLLFLYICDKCDLAGFWEVDLELAAYFTGIKSSQILGAYEGLNRAYIAQGGFIWMRNVIRHQRNLQLNPKNNAHKHILSLLNSHPEFEIDFIEEINKSNNRGSLGALKPPCKGNSISKGNGNSKGKEEKSIFPETLDTPDFQKAWDEWQKYRIQKRNKLTPLTVTKQLNLLSGYPVETAIATIERSIEKGWAGLFPDKEQNNGRTGVPQTQRKTPEQQQSGVLGDDFGDQKSEYGTSIEV